MPCIEVPVRWFAPVGRVSDLRTESFRPHQVKRRRQPELEP